MLGSFHYATLPGFRAFRPPRTCPDAPGIPSGKAVLLSFLPSIHLFICWTISRIELQLLHALEPPHKLVKSPQCEITDLKMCSLVDQGLRVDAGILVWCIYSV